MMDGTATIAMFPLPSGISAHVVENKECPCEDSNLGSGIRCYAAGIENGSLQ
jgi:hypothetical protein